MMLYVITCKNITYQCRKRRNVCVKKCLMFCKDCNFNSMIEWFTLIFGKKPLFIVVK